MKNQNLTTLEFFLSGYRLGDAQERRDLVTENFTFSTPVADALTYEEFHSYNSVMLNHTEREIVKIHTIDNDHYIVDIINTVVENNENYNQDIEITLHVEFIGNLVDSLKVEYQASEHDNKIFEKILSPIISRPKT